MDAYVTLGLGIIATVLAGCAAGVVEHLGGVAGKVADAGVDLG